MIDPGLERHLGWLERILGRKDHIEVKDAVLVRCILGAVDGRPPLEKVVLVGCCGAMG